MLQMTLICYNVDWVRKLQVVIYLEMCVMVPAEGGRWSGHPWQPPSELDTWPHPLVWHQRVQIPHNQLYALRAVDARFIYPCSSGCPLQHLSHDGNNAWIGRWYEGHRLGEDSSRITSWPDRPWSALLGHLIWWHTMVTLDQSWGWSINYLQPN